MTHHFPAPRKSWNWKFIGIAGAVVLAAGALVTTAVGAATTDTTSAACTSPTPVPGGYSADCSIFVPVVTPAPVTQTVTVTAAPTTPTTPPTTPTPTPTTTAPSGLSLSPVDGGGPAFYNQFTNNGLPSTASFFPIGVWEQNYCQADEMTADGINVLVDVQGSPPGTSGSVCTTQGPTIPFKILDDEADMWGGPGNGAFVATGKTTGIDGQCATSADYPCGFTAMAAHQTYFATDMSMYGAGTLRYANYGKGVEFWWTQAQAAQFVNQYQDVVSADLYWGTDSDLCQASQGGQLLGTNANLATATCHKASNYGITVDRIRSLQTTPGSQPIWNYVEIGHPNSNGGAMPPAEIKAAVWSSLIHGARGIVYFDHSFGGSCISDDVLKDCAQSTTTIVKAINAQITSLAPVLNSQIVNGVTTGSNLLDAAAHYDGHNVYVFAEPNGTAAVNNGTIKVAGYSNGTATVIGESRTVPVVNGQITDSFVSANTVHLYEFS